MNVLWHIGVCDLPNDDWKAVVEEQAKILKANSMNLYVSLHATVFQKMEVDRILRAHNVSYERHFRYEKGLWEVETLKWFQREVLPHLDSDEFVAYMHTIGATNPGKKRIRWYLMDHLFVDLEKNIEELKQHKKRAGGVFAIMNKALEEGLFWSSFWIARVDRVREAKLNMESRWGAEEFIRPKMEDSMFFDHYVTVAEIDENICDKQPFYWVNGETWQPSQKFLDLTDYTREDVEPRAEVEKASRPTNLHSIYVPTVIAIVMFFIVFLVI